MVLDYAISAQKYPKIVTQEKEKFKESPTVFFFFFFMEFWCRWGPLGLTRGAHIYLFLVTIASKIIWLNKIYIFL